MVIPPANLPVDLWTSPADRPEPCGTCGQPMDRAAHRPSSRRAQSRRGPQVAHTLGPLACPRQQRHVARQFRNQVRTEKIMSDVLDVLHHLAVEQAADAVGIRISRPITSTRAERAERVEALAARPLPVAADSGSRGRRRRLPQV